MEKQKQKSEPYIQKNGFYDTLIIKKEKPEIKKSLQICNKIGNVKKLINKKYMIPSQFPNITKVD